MEQRRIDIWNENEYTYAAAYGFMPNLRTYLHDDEEIRPCMIVVPGGGYCMVVSPEAEIVAKEFYNRGMNALVLTYTTDITTSVPLKDQPLKDISRAVRLVRAQSEELRIDPSKITVCGFSAGGHVCATLSTHFDDVKDSDEKLDVISNRPDAAILSYPVISCVADTHEYSVWSLLGKNPSKEDLEYYSAELNVKEDTPPTFIWQTVDDNLVPSINSFLYAKACKDKGVELAYYAFPHGFHGLSVANEDFLKGNFGEPYTFEQLDLAIDNVKKNTAYNISEERREELLKQFPDKTEDEGEAPAMPEPVIPNDVAMWPSLAEIWLKDNELL